MWLVSQSGRKFVSPVSEILRGGTPVYAGTPLLVGMPLSRSVTHRRRSPRRRGNGLLAGSPVQSAHFPRGNRAPEFRTDQSEPEAEARASPRTERLRTVL